MGAPGCRALWEKGAQVNTTRIPDQGLTIPRGDNRAEVTLKSYFKLLNETWKLMVLQIFKSLLFLSTHLNQK